MGTVAVLGEPERVHGFALAGAIVIAAVGPGAVRRAWGQLDEGTALVVLTRAAAESLTAEIRGSALATVVMPE